MQQGTLRGNCARVVDVDLSEVNVFSARRWVLAFREPEKCEVFFWTFLWFWGIGGGLGWGKCVSICGSWDGLPAPFNLNDTGLHVKYWYYR